VLVGDLGLLYLAVALVAGGRFTRACHHHVRRLEAATARKVFLASLGYLGALFAATALDVALF
jgi:heme O synthase-like polyprenyltransferase